MTKLSKVQQEVIELMKAGWELGVSSGAVPRAWLQKNGVGRGGETKKLAISTYHKLRDLGYFIMVHDGFPVKKYRLKEIL